MKPLISGKSSALRGELKPPGDKSISHRTVILGGIASGITTVHGMLEGEDVLCTVAAMTALGANISNNREIWRIEGAGLKNLQEPDNFLDVGNSGTSARLLIGLLGARPFTSFFTGDASLRKRPMGRVISPMQQIGSQFMSRSGGKLPLSVIGTATPKPITYTLPVASAQVKSAVLLAGLSAEGVTTVIEKSPTRDHTELMLRYFGANINVVKTAEGFDAVSLIGQPELIGREITVPADISSAAFPLVAALLRPDSAVKLCAVGINPRRTGLLKTLLEMGANIQLENERVENGEMLADIIVKHGTLRGVTVPAERAPSMIDEYPVLAMAAACASGVTRMCGLGELRVKESDRLALVATGLAACGVNVDIEGDDLIVNGSEKPPKGGAFIKTALDHRIAMSFLVLGTATAEPIKIDDGSVIATSFPDFVELMNKLGAKIENADTNTQ